MYELRKNNLIEDGLNILEGGEGGPAIGLPMLQIAKYIAMGYTITDIHYLIINKYKIQCTLQTVRARIIDYWESFENAQVMFLRPMLEILIKARFELYEINEAYGRFMLERIKLFFGGKSYRELLRINKKDLSSLRIFKPFPLWTNTGRIKSIIPIGTLKFLIRRYLYAIDAINDKKVISLLSVYSSSDVKRQNLVYQVQQQLDYNSWNEARDAIAIPYLIEKLRIGKISPKNVYMAIGYKESSSRTHDTLSRTIFFGLNTSEVQGFLRKHHSIKNYKEFEKIVLLERKNRKKLKKKNIDTLLLRYTRSSDMIKNLNGWFTGDFLDEVGKYYPDFKLGKWMVKAPFVIKMLRDLPDKYESEEFVNIFKNLGYSEGTAKNYPRLIRDMFFGMSMKECIEFFKKHSGIETYIEARTTYKKEYGIDMLRPYRSRYYSKE